MGAIIALLWTAPPNTPALEVKCECRTSPTSSSSEEEHPRVKHSVKDHERHCGAVENAQ